MDFVTILLLDLFVTVFLYLLVPVIFCLRKKPMTQKQIKKVIIINAICVWLLFQIIISASGGSGTSAAVFLWSWVGYSLMKKKLLITEEPQTDVDISPATSVVGEPVAVSDKILFCRKCGEKLVDDARFCRKCGTQVITEEGKNDL